MSVSSTVMWSCIQVVIKYSNCKYFAISNHQLICHFDLLVSCLVEEYANSKKVDAYK